MKWENFTAERVAGFKCKPDKTQTIYWDGKEPGLGLRVTNTGAKAFIFETALNGKTIRMTIGNSRTWGIGNAQKEAKRLKAMTDQGIDLHQVIADGIAAKKDEATALSAKEIRETVTLGMVWPEHVSAKKSKWGALHLHDHVKAMQTGGDKGTRSHKLTEPGALALLATVRLVDLTPEVMKEWGKVEGAKRPARARNARTLLSTFLNWCAAHPIYKDVVNGNPAQSSKAKEHLGKAQAEKRRATA